MERSLELWSSDLDLKKSAASIAVAIFSKDIKEINLLFERVSLVNIAINRFIVMKSGSSVNNSLIVINIEKQDLTNERWISNEFTRAVNDFHRLTSNQLNWIIIIGYYGISYVSNKGIHYSFISYPDKKEELTSLLTSVVININSRPIFNSETFDYQFGSYSPFYAKARSLMKKFLSLNQKKVNIIYEKWKSYFVKIYQTGDVDEELFIKHAYLALLVKIVLFCYHFPKEIIKNDESLLKLTSYLKNREIELLSNDFFNWVDEIDEIQKDLFMILKDATYESEDIFRVIYQDMISSKTRKTIGEFYTPPELVSMMVDDAYEFGNTVLDPACGSGTFIVEIIKKINSTKKTSEEKLKAIANLYGFDLNPIAVLVTKANILLQLGNDYKKVPINVFLTDSLFPIVDLGDTKVDLAIGNPPWITITGILSRNYKKKIKDLAESFNIMYGQEAKNTEICTLFFHKMKETYVKNGGTIFFATPASLLTGNQHSKFRLLEGFSTPVVWKFTQDVFNIHNICFKVRLMETPLEQRLNYIVRLFDYDTSTKTIIEKKTQIFQPAYLKDEKKKINGKETIIGKLVGRMNPKDEKTSFTVDKSYYRDKFNRGIQFSPRRYLIIKIKEQKGDNFVIIPDTTQQSKPAYESPPYKETIIDSNYIHPIITTKDCIQFLVLNYQKAFLPIRKDEKKINVPSLPINVKKHYERLDKSFIENAKESSCVNSLWENIIYGPSTINTRKNNYYLVLSGSSAQMSVVIPASQAYVDTGFYFFETEDIDEAYYLCGYLNAPITMENIKKLGASGAGGSLRHIHKRPFDFPLPKFTKTELQMKIAETTKKCETLVKRLVNKWVNKQYQKHMGKYYCPFCIKVFSARLIHSHMTKCTYQNQPKTIINEYSPIKIVAKSDIILKQRTIQNTINKSKEYQLLLQKLDNYIIKMMNTK